MTILFILAPLLAGLLLPLGIATVSYRRWSQTAGAPRGRRRRVTRAAVCFICSLFLTSLLLSPLVMSGWWCRATARGDATRGDSFVVFAFGEGPSSAGASNVALAEWLVANNPDRKPVVVQPGIRSALLALSTLEPNCINGWTIIGLPEHDGVYVDTEHAAFQVDVVLDRLHLTRPILVAHDLQLQRMVWALDDAGIRDVIVPDLPPTPFDPESVQHWGTRWKAIWLAREVFAARPLTLRSRATMLVVGLAAALYAVAAYRVWRHYNPLPIVTILFPFANGLLVVRRAIRPAVGKLAFPGGYVDEDEPWQAAAVRELREETGLEVERSEVELFTVSSTRRGHMVVIYALVRPQAHRSLPPPRLAREISELRVLMRPVNFVWEQDTEAARRYFATRPTAPPGTPDSVPIG